VLKRIREEFETSLSAEERTVLRPAFSTNRTHLAAHSSNAPVVKEWRMSDFDLREPLRNRSVQRGKAAFASAHCILCHRFGPEGGVTGPDLTDVARRFDRRAMLEAMIEPSKVMDEKFRSLRVTLKDGQTVGGTLEREDEGKLILRENPLSEQQTEITKDQITSRSYSDISPMPEGLVNTLTKDQILDLLAFLESPATP
jgi:hypothetical protein